MTNWLKRIPGKVWLAVGCLLVAAFWMEQHDAHVRQQARLQQMRQQMAVQVAALKKQAEREVKQANVENARAIEKIDVRRRQLAHQNLKLAAQLDALRKQARIQAEQVATLPIGDVVTRVAAQLGLNSEDLTTEETAAARKGAKAQSKLQVTNYELPKADDGKPDGIANSNASGSALTGEMTPHPATGAATLSPWRGLDQASFAHIAENATAVPAAGKEEATSHKGARPQSSAKAQSVALALTASGARKVETALVELNSCRAESNVQSRQISNCQARAQADDAVIQRQAGSIASLNQALQAKDKILNQQASACKAELKAAKGTFLGHLAHATEHIVIGIAAGLAIGVAVR